MKILICDDDRDFARGLKTSVEEILEKKHIAGKVSLFHAAEEIGGETLTGFDLAFLDIDFAGKAYNGLDIARRIREKGADTVIVFVTNYLEYAPVGYEVRAFRYLLKEELPKKLEDCLEQARGQMRKEKSDIRIQVEGEEITLMLRDVLYVESMGHSLIFHARCRGYDPDRSYSCYGAIGKMEEELSPRGFLRTQKSYLVNMAHIKSFNSRELVLSNGVSLPVGSKSYAACKRSYLLWRGKQ